MHCIGIVLLVNNGLIADVLISILQVDMDSGSSSKQTITTNMDGEDVWAAMTHLTDEEKDRILEVMRRAECLDKEASQRTK